MAAVSLPIALGPILGPVLGGVILNWLSRRRLFLINVLVIAVGLLLARRFSPTTAPTPLPHAHAWTGPAWSCSRLVLTTGGGAGRN